MLSLTSKVVNVVSRGTKPPRTPQGCSSIMAAGVGRGKEEGRYPEEMGIAGIAALVVDLFVGPAGRRRETRVGRSPTTFLF